EPGRGRLVAGLDDDDRHASCKERGKVGARRGLVHARNLPTPCPPTTTPRHLATTAPASLGDSPAARPPTTTPRGARFGRPGLRSTRRGRGGFSACRTRTRRLPRVLPTTRGGARARRPRQGVRARCARRAGNGTPRRPPARAGCRGRP